MPARQFDLNIRVKASDDGATGVLGSIGGGLQKLGALAITGIGAIGAGVGFIASQAIPAASNLNEALNASGVVFGEASGIIQKFGETAWKSVGMSKEAFNQLAATTGAMLKNYGFDAEGAANATVDLGQRAADMASIFNTDVSSAMEAINAALRGEANPIERYGVSMNAAAVEAKAMSMGLEKVNGKFTTFSLTQARLALLMEQTNDIAGDFTNTSDQLANATRVNEARWKNFLATIGGLGLPIMNAAQGILMDIGDVAIPIVEGAIASALPFIKDVASGIGTFVNGLISGQPPLDAFAALLRGLGFIELATSIQGFIPFIDMLIAKANELLGPIFEWISQNISLGDVLIGLGVAIASIVIPIVASLISTFAPIIAIFAGVVLAVALVRAAWENDFLGIRSMFERVWEQGILPAFEYMQTNLFPRVTAIIEYFGMVWEQKIMPALERAGVQMKGDFIPAIGDLLIGAVGGAVTVIEALIGVVEWLMPAIASVADAVGWVIDRFTEWRKITADLYRWLSSLIIPDWLTPGSPTPLELGVRGIVDAMGELADQQLPALSRGLAIANPLQASFAGAGAAGSPGNQPVRIEVPLIMDGKEVGHAAIEGTLDALTQRGKKFRKSTG